MAPFPAAGRRVVPSPSVVRSPVQKTLLRKGVPSIGVGPRKQLHDQAVHTAIMGQLGK